ncbi:MAG: hypothetical protein IJ418_02510 [Clostridia bacterium]|nr:hypothetical protein [Clostridia bacterium]
MADYENLGLEPADLAVMIAAFRSLKVALEGEQAANLIAALDAIAKGRVITLPEDLPRWTCGNECYCLRGGEIDRALILSLEITDVGKARFDLLDMEQNRFERDMSEIGKTVFQTKEDAEKRRREFEENGQN